MTEVRPRDVLKSHDFRLLQAGRFLSTVGVQMQSVAVGWQVYELTHDALHLGYVGLSQFVPALLFSLLAGETADRFDRRKILIVCYGLLFLCSVGLSVASLSGLGSVWPIYVALVLFGTARAFAGPAGTALLPQVVPTEHFSAAVAWSSSVWQVATIAGPALGGLVYGWAGGAASVYATAAVLDLSTLLFAVAMRVRPGRLAHGAQSWERLWAGVRFVWARKIVLGAISLDLFAVLLGGAVALLPMYAKDILHIGPSGLGVLRSAPAAGAAIMAIFLAHRPIRRKSGKIMLWAVAVFGVATCVFGMSRSPLVSLVALFIIGASDMVSVVIRHTLVQLNTPSEMRGRVSAVNNVFIGASNELGEFESGVTAAWFGPIAAVLIGGVGTLVVVALWSTFFPALRDADRLDGAVDEGEKKPA